MKGWPSAPLLADVRGFVFDPHWTPEGAPLTARVYRDDLDRIQIGVPPVHETYPADPLVWVGHNQ